MPESLRSIAFQRALDELLGVREETGGPPSPAKTEGALRGVKSRGKSGGADARASATDVVPRLLESLNRTELADLMAGRKVLDRALLVLRAAQHHGIDVMSAREIAEVLTQKFRERTNTEAVRIALERAPSYTDRRTRDGTVVYVLMAPGERYLDAATKGSDTTEGGASRARGGGRRAGGGAAKRGARSGARGTKRSSQQTKATAAADDSKSTTAPQPRKAAERSGGATRKTSGRPGPKALLEDLLGQGVFDTPQTIGSLLDYIERKRGHRYGANEFSPALTRLLRENKLDRDRNADGQYEYRKHSRA